MLKHKHQNTRLRRAFHRMTNRNLKWLGLPPETKWIPVDVADGLVWDYPVLAIYDPETEERCQIIHYAKGLMTILGEHVNPKIWRHL